MASSSLPAMAVTLMSGTTGSIVNASKKKVKGFLDVAIVLVSRSDSGPAWADALRNAAPDEDVRIWPDDGNQEDIDIAVVALPPPGQLARYPNLKAILSLWAGVDSVLNDPDLPPDVPLVRMVEPGLNESMAEYVVAHVLKYHLNAPEYRTLQQERRWKPLAITIASGRRVGILGLGVIGKFVGSALASMNFEVAGWSRSPKNLDGITAFHGSDGLDAFLSRSEIVVALLPLTDETADFLNADLFDRMRPGTRLINVGRGALLNEDDLLAALASGQVAHATLDVFKEEPLPPDHPFWIHPRIDVTPHIASITQVETGVQSLLESIRRIRAGEPLAHVVDRDRGY